MIWPWDGKDGEMGMSQLYQLMHGQPAAHTGIASWALDENKRTTERLRGSGFREGSRRIQIHRLRRLGYRWLISEEEIPAIGEPVERCGSVVVYGLGS
ncbi:MAG: hypothetical protein VX278_22120 [Myxococcota bacterium]|nr:hypothetical protein [Myxococcota bacterium]